MRKVFLSLVVALILFGPAITHAAWIPIVPCGGDGQDSCTPCHLFQTAKNLIDLVLYGITGPIAAFMIVIAGGMMLLGGGKPSLYLDGKKMLTRTLIGVSIILVSWVATNFLIKSLIRGGQGDTWYEFSCPAGLSAIKPIETAIPTGGVLAPLPAATLLEPKFIGVAAVGGIGREVGGGGGSTFSSCNRGMPCLTRWRSGETPGKCPQISPWPSVSNRALLESIMLHESSCSVHPRPSGAGAYGLMQLQPATANLYKEACNVTETITASDGTKTEQPMQGAITAAWLQSEVNVEKIICIADKFVVSLKGSCGNEALNIAAGYNGGPGACTVSRDCPDLPSCVSGQMRRWECPWDNRTHTLANRGYIETRNYAPKVASCAR